MMFGKPNKRDMAFLEEVKKLIDKMDEIEDKLDETDDEEEQEKLAETLAELKEKRNIKIKEANKKIKHPFIKKSLQLLVDIIEAKEDEDDEDDDETFNNVKVFEGSLVRSLAVTVLAACRSVDEPVIAIRGTIDTLLSNLFVQYVKRDKWDEAQKTLLENLDTLLTAVKKRVENADDDDCDCPNCIIDEISCAIDKTFNKN